ncbi:hypothetical protein GP486_001774 [Trichoglossum hirsutum]|uniref:Uncharacterized protein n=1 Tax=Trichoglossum hirsutum TaxID=265104 RepID=A0A9P8RSB1_9PEZI|nr:hypothetical protein GP486_001774 [Trichoglossum hirsutum]
MARRRGCTPGPYNGNPNTATTQNADSWAMFASAAFFTRAWNLQSPPQPDCSSPLTDYDNSNPEGSREPDTNRTDASFNSPLPPPADPAANPLPDGPVPSLPFDPNGPRLTGVATPFPGAEAYFSSLSLTVAFTTTARPLPSPPPTDTPKPLSLPPLPPCVGTPSFPC